jgi:catechol 2,3-dioxygenase-like lactoylglutathione lyase family enzyme
MTIALDHMILPVSDIRTSAAFYSRILGLECEPDALIRISPTLVLQLMERSVQAPYHLAFALPATEFSRIAERLKSDAVPHGSNFDNVGSMTGPGKSHGSARNAKCFYFRDPDGHMLEIMNYG